MSFRRSTAVKLVALAGCLSGAALPTPVRASATSYTIPTNLNFDKLGVDIGSLQYERDDTFLTIGDRVDGGLAWSFIGHSGSDPYDGIISYWVSPASVGNQTQVKIGGHMTLFGGCENGACTNWSGTAATLVKTGSNWFFTTEDGSVDKFDATGNFSDADSVQPTAVLGKLLTITRPSGAVITVNYGSGAGFVVQSVVSSLGYALKYATSGISVVNLASHTCNATVTTCDAVDASIAISFIDVVSGVTGQTHPVEQITDPAGQNWQYEVSDIPVWFDPTKGPAWSYLDGLYYFRSPAGYEAELAFDLAGRLQKFTDNRGAFTYRYPDVPLITAERTGLHGTAGVTDPSGALYFTAASQVSSVSGTWGAYIKDPLGNETQFAPELHTFQDGVGRVGFNRLLSVTQPEGNVRAWSYDSRGNVTAVTDTPKSGSGLSATSITAVYPSSCTNPKTCNKPTSETDANGHTTDYTYDATHGGLLSAMGPAPVTNGARPLKLVTWVQKTPYYKNPSGVLTASATPIWVKASETQCQTVAGASPSPVCDGAAPQTVTTYEYGATGTANALWPHGIAVASGGQTLRTCYTYDALGNKVSETKPNANLSVCP